MNLADAIRAATTRLAAAGVASPRADAELLAAHLLGLTRGETAAAAVLGHAAPDGYDDVVARRAAREPLQHLTGIAHFRGLTLAVGRGVFVPRPETEIVAQAAIDAAAAQAEPVVVDLGTGSGALALAVAAEVPTARVVAVELDAAAHAWAARNAAGTRVELRKGDARTALADLAGLVDVVVANPPYIPPGAVPRDAEVADYDPPVALYGLGTDGLAVPSGFVAAAARLLRPGGTLVLEHGDDQGPALRDIVAAHGFREARTGRDLAGRDRFVVAVTSS